jgi:hypothetical protein
MDQCRSVVPALKPVETGSRARVACHLYD